MLKRGKGQYIYGWKTVKSGYMRNKLLPVARGRAVVKCVARATAAVSIGYC